MRGLAGGGTGSREVSQDVPAGEAPGIRRTREPPVPPRPPRHSGRGTCDILLRARREPWKTKSAKRGEAPVGGTGGEGGGRGGMLTVPPRRAWASSGGGPPAVAGFPVTYCPNGWQTERRPGAENAPEDLGREKGGGGGGAFVELVTK